MERIRYMDKATIEEDLKKVMPIVSSTSSDVYL